jgi:hypothetical protein
VLEFVSWEWVQELGISRKFGKKPVTTTTEQLLMKVLLLFFALKFSFLSFFKE